MGTLVLQYGQCGNQLGFEFFNYIFKKIHQDLPNFYKQESKLCNSILVDTEPKVLSLIKQEPENYLYYNPHNIISSNNGRGNNWAQGYMDKTAFCHLETRRSALKDKIKEKSSRLYIRELIKKNIGLQNLKETLPIKKESQMHATPSFNFPLEAREMSYLVENTEIIEKLQELIRKEIEKIDFFMGTLGISSIAGGTGAGLGSRVMELLRDDYPKIFHNSLIVVPSTNGDSPLSEYNSLLTLNYLQNYADSVVYYSNDKVYFCLSYQQFVVHSKVYSILSKTVGQGAQKVINLKSMNEYIASTFANYISLHENKDMNRFYFDTFNSLTPIPALKFLQAISSPYLTSDLFSLGSECTWDNILTGSTNQLRISMDTQLRIKTKHEEEEEMKSNGKFPENIFDMKCLAASILLLSSKTDVANNQANSRNFTENVKSNIKKVLKGCEWNPDWLTIDHIKQKKLDKYMPQKMISVLYNSNDTLHTLNAIVKTAQFKYNAAAYLHWYWKFGIDKEYFEEAFQNLNSVIAEYNEI